MSADSDIQYKRINSLQKVVSKEFVAKIEQLDFLKREKNKSTIDNSKWFSLRDSKFENGYRYLLRILHIPHHSTMAIVPVARWVIEENFPDEDALALKQDFPYSYMVKSFEQVFENSSPETQTNLLFNLDLFL